MRLEKKTVAMVLDVGDDALDACGHRIVPSGVFLFALVRSPVAALQIQVEATDVPVFAVLPAEVHAPQASCLREAQARDVSALHLERSALTGQAALPMLELQGDFELEPHALALFLVA